MSVTFVSGYWKIGRNFVNSYFEPYHEKIFGIPHRMIIFCESVDKNYLQRLRSEKNEKNTLYMNYGVEDFYAMIPCTTRWIRSDKVPMRELGILYHEKVNLLKMAKDMDEKNNTLSDFYVWIDSWNCPLPLRKNDIINYDKLNNLSNLPCDKVCYSRIQEPHSSFCSQVFIVHHSIIDKLHSLYYKTLKVRHSKKINWTDSWDQSIFTELLETYPDFFEKIAEGYGEPIHILFEK